MTQYWIFVSFPYSDYNTGSIFEMMNKLKQSRRWPIGKRTHHKLKLSIDDKILFYQAGEEGKEIVGSGKVVSGLQHDKNSFFDYVIVENIELWDKPVQIRKLIKNLSFVKNKKRWGIHMKGGIVKISEKDYELISKKGAHRAL